MPRLTKSIIDNLKAEDKRVLAFDQGGVSGFCVEAYPSGRKTYYYFYRMKGQTKKKRIKIGVHGSITCEGAREIAQGYAGDVSRGIDPQEKFKQEKQEEKSSINFKDFAELYMEKKASLKNKPKTLKDYQAWLRLHIFPFFAGKKLKDITRKDIHDFHLSLTKKTTANRCISVLSVMFNTAKDWGYYEGDNPCLRFKKHKENKKERFLSLGEIQNVEKMLALEKALGSLSSYGLSAIKLLIYTGCRLQEVLKLKWTDVFLDKDYVHLTDSKGGKRDVVLSEEAKEVFSELKPQEGNSYVFPGKIPGKPLYDLKSQWRKICKLTKLDEVRIHDLRHTFASIAIQEGGLDLYYVSKLLGHKDIHTTTRYAHLSKKDLIRATNVVGKALLKSKEEEPAHNFN
jgi:integrase